MRFAKHDHVVDHSRRIEPMSLNASILPGRSGCDRMVPNAHRTDPLQEDSSIRGVSIPNEISRRVVPRERLGDLARDPLRGWVCRHAKRYPKSSSVAYNDKTIQNLKCDRRQDKEVDRRDAVDVIAEKRPPALRRWPRVAAHVPSDRRLGDLEAELEQLTGAPQSTFARLISPMSVRSSAETFGLPTRLRDRQRQYARNPARCQRMMVSGLTIATTSRTDGNQR